MQPILHGEVGRGHVVVAHRHENLEIRIARQRVAQRDAGVNVAVVRVPIPGARDAAAENVVFDVTLVTKLAAHVLVESRSVGRPDGRLAGVKIRAVARVVRVKAFETSIKPANRSSLRAQQFLAKETERHPQVRVVDELRRKPGVARHLCDCILPLLLC